ncbi:MAG: enoyl-CoA hydratase/isomerase family protein [Flavobacteriaceae bacterium]|nr:enoyl-CoA hydratase/isomerase family protein [Flavobacteriaceae bacterium]MCY4217310.1 enoyl-CoA hydratase/isomerase family protein [Flavobacteriaceae bacterium]MCY4254078.1 enoyl-CoA hydratase/isomerase family protein [Flavobacteriaceae bacterium]
MSEVVNIHVEHQIGFLEFGSSKANALTKSLLKKISDALLFLDENSDVHVILMNSIGNKIFTAGASLTELAQIKTMQEATDFFQSFADLIKRFRNLTKFSVLQVQGKVLGGGLGIVAAADYVIASNSAAVKLSELSIGIGPYVIAPAVKRKIGTSAFNQLSIESHQFKSAKWGLDRGLYHVLVENSEALAAKAIEMAKLLASYSPMATKSLRKLHWNDTQEWDELLSLNATKTAQLALQEPTQKILKSWKKFD